MPKILYSLNFGTDKLPSVIIFGDKYGEKIEMTESQFEELVFQFNEKRDKAYDSITPIDQKLLKEIQKTNKLLEELLGKNKK